MIHATISADIIASSSLSGDEFEHLTQRVYTLFDMTKEYLNKNNRGEILLYRIVLGDRIECLINNPSDALRVSLIVKMGVKSFPLDDKEYDTTTMKYRKIFQQYGARVAVGIGEMDTELVKQNLLKGDAINRSGRIISEQKTSNKERIVMKNTLFFSAPSTQLTNVFQTIMGLLDLTCNKMTQKQSEVIFWKLLGFNENEIASEFNVSQSSINQQSKAAGWSVIEDALKLYESTNFKEISEK